ncbi:uncharacterized protein LOC134264868 [Saccostrea cucullata]|uniref:uncharacterized protein LOC134264868 n=1 Tax=Saccostrea cuccullata TaxID=36930 RepID=UPI002ED61A05
MGSLVAVFGLILLLITVSVVWKRMRRKRRKEKNEFLTEKEKLLMEKEKTIVLGATKKEEETGTNSKQNESENDIMEIDVCSENDEIKQCIADVCISYESKGNKIVDTKTRIHNDSNDKKYGITDAGVNWEPEEMKHSISETGVHSEPEEKEHSISEADVNGELQERTYDVTEVDVNGELQERKQDVIEADVNGELQKWEHDVTDADVYRELQVWEHDVTEADVNEELQERKHDVIEAEVNGELQVWEHDVTDAGIKIESEKREHDVTETYINIESENMDPDVTEADINIESEKMDHDVTKADINIESEKMDLDVTNADINIESEKMDHDVTKADINIESENRDHDVKEADVNIESVKRDHDVTEAEVNGELQERHRDVTESGVNRESGARMIRMPWNDSNSEKRKLMHFLPSSENGRCVGGYYVWRTKISDQFSTLTDDEVSVLFCFLCSDSGPPDFTDTEWLDLLNRIRQEMCRKYNPVKRKKAQQTLDRLKSHDYLWENQDKVTKDTKDETMYRIAITDKNIPFCYSSYDTASMYLRSERYNRKPGEKCVICNDYDRLLIRRLQMNILTHVTMEDTRIYDEIYQILNVSEKILRESDDQRKEFLMDQRREVEAIYYRGRSQDSVNHVRWLWRYLNPRPDIVRSCIGLHQHWDIYIIDNKAYRKPCNCHTYSLEIRNLLYSILFAEKYQLNLDDQSHKITMEKIRDRYFTDITDDGSVDLPDGIAETQDRVITFISDDIRHDIMYAFVTECLVEDSDLEFFLTTASRDVISEYCVSWGYKRNEGDRCLYVPNRPEKMYDLFMDKLQLDIISHRTMSDGTIHARIRNRLKVPEEILKWDQKARERYVQYAERGGVQEVHHARGMIVGCAGAGKTTLLNRLLKRNENELKKIESTEGLEVHEEVFEVCKWTGTLKAREKYKDQNNERNNYEKMDSKTLTFFDFAGQCAYYACHQIYLTRRAFYVVVVDASKRLDQKVDKEVCDQEDTVFANWEYKDYFLFWMKSIHTYCHGQSHNDKDSKVIIIIIATHWDKCVYKDKVDFMNSLQMVLPVNSYLAQYIREDMCFCTNLLKDQIDVIEEVIVQVVKLRKWSEKIPSEWILTDTFQKERHRRVMNINDIKNLFKHYGDERQVLDLANDMLRYYHDAGKVLHFDEKNLTYSVIIDVQWFVNTFKSIMTDMHHVKGIDARRQDWEEFYKTGNLKDSLLNDIWRIKDERLLKTKTKSSSEEIKFGDDPSFIMYHKEELLLYMQRLGLISSEGETHYVPSMNKKDFGETQKEIIKRSSTKTSVLVFLFDFLPYFFFYRLVVALMQIEDWKVLRSYNISCLYKNAAMFTHSDHDIALAVTPSTIQLQIFQSISQMTMCSKVTFSIRKTVEEILGNVTKSFHKSLAYEVGFMCDEDKNQILGEEVTNNFIQEGTLDRGNQIRCPQHQVEGFHTINPDFLLAYWK